MKMSISARLVPPLVILSTSSWESGDSLRPCSQRDGRRGVGGPDHRCHGDATSQHDVSAAVLGQDTVVSTRGVGRSLVAKERFTRTSAVLIGAAEQQGFSRLV
ncbi:hypothetical protein ACFZCU_44190 [Streptomyces canus]|uniref:hypothetical protein n=1 Tax=Streptomyces canus TaxID=58343 RepID=UPI0036EC33FD